MISYNKVYVIMSIKGNGHNCVGCFIGKHCNPIRCVVSDYIVVALKGRSLGGAIVVVWFVDGLCAFINL